VWDKTLAELHTFPTRGDPLQDYYEKWAKAYELRWAELTGEGSGRLATPLTEEDMRRCQHLRGERETPEVAYLIILHGQLATLTETGSGEVRQNYVYQQAVSQVRNLLESLAPGQGQADYRQESLERRTAAFISVIASGIIPSNIRSHAPHKSEEWYWWWELRVSKIYMAEAANFDPNPLVNLEYRARYAAYVAECLQAKRKPVDVKEYRPTPYPDLERDEVNPRPWVTYVERLRTRLVGLRQRGAESEGTDPHSLDEYIESVSRVLARFAPIRADSSYKGLPTRQPVRA
jgi:hypothetical protein